MTATPLIRTSNLSIELNGHEILRRIGFTVGRGEYLSIIGPNGAGKSTLLRCLCRIERRWRGTLELDGRPLASIRQREFARTAGYVPQAHGPCPPFTVGEFVRMGRYPYRTPFESLTPEDLGAVREAMEKAGVERFEDRRLATLSGGERQMVYLAATLAQGAEILLLDEPATFLDYRHQVELMRTLRALHRDAGVTVIAVDHDLNRVTGCSDRVLALRDGGVFFDGPPVALLEGSRLETLYGTPFTRIDTDLRPIPVVVCGEGI